MEINQQIQTLETELAALKMRQAQEMAQSQQNQFNPNVQYASAMQQVYPPTGVVPPQPQMHWHPNHNSVCKDSSHITKRVAAQEVVNRLNSKQISNYIVMGGSLVGMFLPFFNKMAAAVVCLLLCGWSAWQVRTVKGEIASLKQKYGL